MTQHNKYSALSTTPIIAINQQVWSQLHTGQISRLHLQRLRRYHATTIKQTYVETPAMTRNNLRTTRHISRNTFWFVDTHKQTCTHRQIDRRLTTITAFTITAGKQ